MSLKEGRKFPDFRLPATSGEVFHLHQLRQPCILLFLHNSIEPLDQAWLAAFRDHAAPFTAAGVVTLGVCCNSLDKLNRARQAQQLPFELLSDWYGEVADLCKLSLPAVHYTKRVGFFLDSAQVIRERFPPKRGVGAWPEVMTPDQIAANVRAFQARLQG